jgi:hypothetical protein
MLVVDEPIDGPDERAARKPNGRSLRSGTRMSVRFRNLSHAVPHTVPVRHRLAWMTIVWWGCLPNTTHQRICGVCAISGLLRAKRPRVNASRNIRPRSVGLLLSIHFCRPNELAVSFPLCIVPPPHQDQGCCGTAPSAAQVDHESCFSIRGLFPSSQEILPTVCWSGGYVLLLPVCCDDSSSSQDCATTEFEVMAPGHF